VTQAEFSESALPATWLTGFVSGVSKMCAMDLIALRLEFSIYHHYIPVTPLF
jgi:hypothetical protein